MMEERGVVVDHATLNRWVIKYGPEFEKAFRRRHQPVGRSWRMDEMYVRIKGQWTYLYRAVDKAGHTVEFLLTSTRDRAAAMAFLRQAIRQHGCPETITIDQSGSNTAAIQQYNRVHHTGIAIRQYKYLNNLVEQDHRAVKRKVRSMVDSSPLRRLSVRWRALRLCTRFAKGNCLPAELASRTPAVQFYSLAA
jgi:transposase-like protein